MKKYVKNIKAVYEQSTGKEYLDGVRWYREAKAKGQEIADRNKVPLHIAVGVIAALSPTNKWERNIIDADSLIHHFMIGGYMEDVNVSTYNTMKLKAWTILNTMGDYEETAIILNGPKITDFYRCIMGENVCVIDGHAWCIANNDRRILQEVPNIGKKLRVAMQEAYKEAGASDGLTAYEMQAITWLTWKRIYNI